MIVLRTKHYAAADFINNVTKFAKKRQSLIKRATSEGNHDLASSLRNATDSEFAQYLRDRDKIAESLAKQGSEARNYIKNVKGAMSQFDKLNEMGFNYKRVVNGHEDVSPEFHKVRTLAGTGGIRTGNGKEAVHIGQSEELKNNLKTKYRNQRDGDYGNLYNFRDDPTIYHELAGTASYNGDVGGARTLIQDLNTNGNRKNYMDYLSSGSIINKVGEGGTAAANLNNKFSSSIQSRQAKEAQIKAQQEAARKAAEEAAAKKAQQEADEKARREAAEARKRAEREEEEQRRIRQQQQQEEFEKREEKRQQEQRDIQRRAEERSQRKGLYTGLGIAGGTAVLGGGIYALSRNNNNNNNNNNR